jgi:hypothetical protein
LEFRPIGTRRSGSFDCSDFETLNAAKNEMEKIYKDEMFYTFS